MPLPRGLKMVVTTRHNNPPDDNPPYLNPLYDNPPYDKTPYDNPPGFTLDIHKMAVDRSEPVMNEELPAFFKHRSQTLYPPVCSSLYLAKGWFTGAFDLKWRCCATP
jgi:hypothetical protein